MTFGKWGRVLPALALAASALAASGQAPLTDPLIGHADAIEAGKQIYRSHCYICHLHRGGRGPNLFATTLSDQDFAAVVLGGRGLMPAWGERLSLDEVWQIRAFLKSASQYDD